MTKHIRLALIASACLVLPGAAETQAQHFPLESTDRLKLHNVTAEPTTLHGKKGLHLTLAEEVRRRVKTLESMTPEERERSMTPEERARVRNGLPFLVGQLTLVQELEFSNGTYVVRSASSYSGITWSASVGIACVSPAPVSSAGNGTCWPRGLLLIRLFQQTTRCCD